MTGALVPPPPPPLSPADRFADVDPRSLIWLALLPRWTLASAAELGLSDEPDRLLELLTDADLVETRRVRLPGAGRTTAFWLRPRWRAALGTYLRGVSEPAQVEHAVTELARAVDGTPARHPELLAWLNIVRHHLPDPSGASLIDAVDALLADGRPGEAAALVATACGVAEIVGGTLVGAAFRAQWRVDLHLRTADDRRYLRHYYRRWEIEEAFAELLADRGETWVLHLLGDGGSGKTMAVRYLSAGQYAHDRRLPRIAVARVDFDHLDPRFPLARPAVVLQALADELTGFGVTRGHLTAHRIFVAEAEALHEELAGATPDPGRVEALLQRVVAAFAALLAGLPHRVVLVFDTCEELTKLYPVGATAPAIDRTFWLLERIHAAHPQLRVVMAGRRPLVPEPSDGSAAAGPQLAARPYLRPLRVGGFRRDEAEGYLDARSRARAAAEPDAPTLRPELRAALLGRASELGSVPPRYNPFELAAYCEWAFAEPDLDPALLQAAGDPYVERRIVARLPDGPVRHGLAAAVEFGRFDRELAAAAWRRGGIDPDAAFDGLAAQEWVNVLATGTDGRPKVLEVDEHLRDRIRAVTRSRPDEYPLDRSLLGADAAAVVVRTAVVDLPAETLEAAVALLPPAEAARWWVELDERIVDGGTAEWAWAAQVMPRVAAVELARFDRAGRDEPTILAAILATRAAALIHTGQPGVIELWRAVEAVAGRHPDPLTREVLLARGRLGRIAAEDPTLDVDNLGSGSRTRAGPAGSVAAALSALLRTDWSAAVDRFAGRLLGAAPDTPEGAVGATTALVWLTMVLHGQREDDAARYADQALVCLSIPAGSARWADWVPPPGLLDRARAARLYVALLGREALAAHPWLAWRAEALTRLPDVDAERLVALTTVVELAHRPVGLAALASMTESEMPRYPGPRPPAIWLHRATGPLVVELAEAWRVSGRPDRAAELLVDRRNAAFETGADPDLVEACELGLLRLDRRRRTAEHRSLPQLARSGPAPVRAAAWRVLTLVRGERPADPTEAGSWHAWWQCGAEPAPMIDSMRHAALAPVPGIPLLAQLADVHEAGGDVPEGQLSGEVQLHGSTIDDRERAAAMAVVDLRERAEHLVRLGRPPRHLPPGLLGRAQLAAGEMLALREPGRGAAMLARAGQLLRRAGDDPGSTEAFLLAALAAGRVDDREHAAAAWRLAERDVLAGGWAARAEAVSRYLHGGTADFRVPSPELDLPGRASPPTPGAAVPAPSDTWWMAPRGPGRPASLSPAASRRRWPVVVGIAVVLLLAVLSVTMLRPSAGPVGAPAPTVLPSAVPTASPPVTSAAPASEHVWVVEPGTTATATATAPATAPAPVEPAPSSTHSIAEIVLGSLLLLAGPVALLALVHRRQAPYYFVRPRAFRITPNTALVRRHRGLPELDGSRLPGLPRREREEPLDPDAAPWEPVERRPGPPRELVELDVTAADLPERPWERWVAAQRPRPCVVYRRVPGHRHTAARDSKFLGPRHLRSEPGRRIPYGVVHVVGGPVDSVSGWRLRVQDTADTAAESSWTRGTVAGEQLVGLESLAVQVETCALLVLQAEPVDGPPRELSVLRPGFLGLARAALERGAGAVLIVPPLPDALAAAMVRTVWEGELPRSRQPRPSEIVALAARLLDRTCASDILLFTRTGRVHR